MPKTDERLKEIIRGLDSLVMLTQWEQTLARDLRDKAEALAAGGGNKSEEDAGG